VSHVLRVTKRCLVEDLGLSESAAEIEPAELVDENPLLRAFVERRSQSPIGQETVEGLTAKIVAYSLHSGEYRGLTWHHEKAGVVWLLAARFHRSGDPDDAYPHFRDLGHAGRLLPTDDDIRRHLAGQEADLARVLLEEVPAIVDQLRSNPGRILVGNVGGRINVRAVWEADDPPMLTIAISQRLRPGEMQVPTSWQLAVAAAFLPNADPASLSLAWDLAGRPLSPDEIAYCDFAR
jgi:hypothetical protein